LTIHSIPAALETKSADTDPVAEVKQALAGLTADINEKTAPVADLATRLDEIEAKLARPNLGGKAKADDEDNIEHKALDKALRNGVHALDADEQKALNWGTGSAGGYVTAPEYSTQIVNKISELSPIRRLASVMSIGSEKVYVPTIASQIDGGWVTETGTRTEDEPTFGQVAIDVFEHAVIVPVSLQLLEDSFIDLPGFLAGHIAERFAKAESTAFVIGDGSGKPEGILDDANTYSGVTADQDGSDLIEKLIALYYTLPSTYAANGSWLMNRNTMGLIRAAADNTTKGTLWSDSLANGQPARFLGAPVAESPDMDDLVSGDSPAGDTVPVVFGDFATAYRVVDRVGVQILRDDFTGRSTGLVKFHARRRVGGKIVQPEALVTLTGSAA
jgi:HK97 family phage major capsid protein